MSDGELTIDGYQLVNCIHTGNSSQVWEVREQVGSRQLAMKLLLPEAMSDSDQVKTLKHEARVTKSLEHPNIVKFHKLVTNKKSAYMIMDYFRAPNVKQQIMTDMLGLHVRFRKLLEQTCLALGYLHEKGWLQRDVKPDNILFNKGSELRLVDFSLAGRLQKGIGRLIGGKSRSIQGTRTYIAPETLLKRAQTEQTDMYSLGVTLFEILTGGPPFRGSSPSDLLRKHVGETPPTPSNINPNIAPEMDKLILRLLEKRPAKRPKSMNELYAEVRNVKIFKEDVEELAERRQREEDQKLRDALDKKGRLDSREDALRSELELKDPSLKKKTPPPPARPAPPVAPPAVAGPHQRADTRRSPATPPQGHPPQMPGYAPPGYGPPGQPFAYGPPGQPYPYPYPMPAPPGMPPPQSPPAPSSAESHPPRPPSAAPQPVPAKPAPAKPAPAKPAPAKPAPAKPAPAKPSEKPTKDDELPFMEDLPPVL